MTISHWQASSIRSFDLVVVGAGIVGSSVAYWFKRLAQGKTIAIVDKSGVGSGASGRNAGFVIQGLATYFTDDVARYGEQNAWDLYRLTESNRDLLFEEFGNKLPSLKRTGYFIAAGTQEEAAAVEESTRMLKRRGVDVEFLGPGELESRFKFGAFTGAARFANGGKVNPFELTNLICQKSESVIVPNTTVTAIEHEEDGVYVVVDGGKTIRAGQVVVATSAHAPQLLTQLENRVRPVRAQMCSTQPIEKLICPEPVYSHRGYFYARQLEDKRILVGGARHLHLDEEVGFEDATTDTLQADLQSYLADYFGIDSPVIERRWSGTMAFTDSGLPIAADVHGDRSVVGLIGFNGHGMSLATALAKELAQYLLGRQADHIDRFMLSH